MNKTRRNARRLWKTIARKNADFFSEETKKMMARRRRKKSQ